MDARNKMTFWEECRWALPKVWKNPWWYIALGLFVFGPFLNRHGLYVWEWPWWAIPYIPLMTVFIFLMAVLLRRTGPGGVYEEKGQG